MESKERYILADKLNMLKGFLAGHDNHATNIRCIEEMLKILSSSQLSDKEKKVVQDGVRYLTLPRNLPDTYPNSVPFLGMEWLDFLFYIRNLSEKL